MANPLMSFLQGGGDSNIAVRLAGLRNQRKLEAQSMGRPTEAMDAEMAADPLTGDVAQAETQKQDALRSMLFDYNRPAVKSMREEELGNKLKLATAPAETAGKYNVQAAQAAGQERAKLMEENQAAQNARQQVTQQGLTGRATAAQHAINSRQQVAGLQSGKIKAPRPAGEGLLSRFLTGPSQSTLNQNAISQIQQDQVSDNPQIGETGVIDGTPVQWDGQGWAVIE